MAYYDDEGNETSWEDSDDLANLEDLLWAGNVTSGDYTADEFHDLMVEYGGPEEWSSSEVNVIFDSDGESWLSVDGERIHIGGQEEFDEIYHWLDDQDIDFDVLYEG